MKEQQADEIGAESDKQRTPAPDEPQELSQLDRAILDFESRHWKRTAIKERAIAEELGLASTEYYLRLARLCGTRQAASYAPMTVTRILEHQMRTRR